MSEQLEIDWRAQRDEGIARSATHAESVNEGWTEEAYATLKRFCIYRGAMPFTSEDFRLFCNDIKFAIPVPKAMGAVFIRARKAGLIVREGAGTAFSRHGSPCPLWKWGQQ